jgi:hypothetical protein
MNASRCTAILLVALSSPLLAEDDMLYWLSHQATTAPATRPTTAPAVAPLVRADIARSSVFAKIKLSDGSMITGPCHSTPGRPLRFWVEAEHQYRDIELGQIAKLEATVLWERDEREWHFVASGSDIKEYTGRTYPARETAYAATLRDGTVFTGSIVAPLYVQVDGQPRSLLLNKRAKGDMGQKLSDLVYVKSVEISVESKP